MYEYYSPTATSSVSPVTFLTTVCTEHRQRLAVLTGMVNVSAIGLLAVLAIASNTAVACSCMAFPADIDKAISMAFAHADVIFLGTVQKTQKKMFRYPPARETDFLVKTSWKGLHADRTKIRSNIGEIACGYKFRKPGTYLVFAYWDLKAEILTTSFCDLNRREEVAKSAIEALNKIATPRHTQSIRPATDG